MQGPQQGYRTGSLTLAISLGLSLLYLGTARGQEAPAGQRSTTVMAVSALVLPTCAVSVGQETQPAPSLQVTCNRPTGYVLSTTSVARSTIEPQILEVAWSGGTLAVLSLDF